ncbi:type II toxin-antitoxin system RelE/ParE family toxin [Eubacterium barkeri]|uniref:Addiction module toxin, RelE/StbE family n=1 Tax=Eubacterium barkeri TaxID=1528 RepID=A0A1H3CBL5_EUBBA|nr:type II toxin-antitoxin system RelE/ParE family toxin [Eubacterium barkeri]SDX51513.1 addiction module toxin, RelE/StbE family [Eubacterium barkeri]
MKHNLHYATQSRRDLDEIWNYIENELQNPSAAKRTVDHILDDVDQLADFAEIGAPLSSIASVKSDYRFLVTGNYLTFYRVYGSEVYVDRVLYGRRDYLRILFDDVLEEETNE